MTEHIHTCNYECQNPDCIRAQRDEFVNRFEQPADEPTVKESLTVEKQAAWDEGYRTGIEDERMSEANIGIAGFGAKVEPARINPYRSQPLYRAPQNPDWVNFKDENRKAAFKSMPDMLEGFIKTWGWLHYSKAIEKILKEKNT
jgi:hypothetical protein